MKQTFAILSFVLTCLGTIGHADSSSYISGGNIALGTIAKSYGIRIELHDQVSGGCWTQTADSKTAVERELIDSGFSGVGEGGWYSPTIWMTAVGYAMNEYSCAVYVQLIISVADLDRIDFDGHEFVATNGKEVFRKGTLLTGPKSHMSQRITDQYRSMIDSFIVDLHRAKTKILNELDAVDAPENAKKEFVDLING